MAISGKTMLRHLSPDKLASLTASVRAGEYNLFIGAGVSFDSKDQHGKSLPGAGDFKDELCAVTGARKSSSLQRVFSGLLPAQVKTHVTDRFLNCEPGPSVLQIPGFVWRRIFTLNVDDALEIAYTKPGNLQTPKVLHFKDSYEEMRSADTIPLIHLHGWVQQPSKGYVFALSEYARVMSETNAWMTVLADIMPVEPFIIAGTSLDEIDLEFYLARRNSTSPRGDRGPSFLVEPFPDTQTEGDCARYGLTHYHGTIDEFLKELSALVPDRTSAYGLMDVGTRELFPDNAPKSVVLSFCDDFDRIPQNASPKGEAQKFAYGHVPEWEDLAGNWDIGRALGGRIRPILEAMIAHKIPERMLVISDDTAVGKTTALRRAAFDLARSGLLVLNCSALSRLETRRTAEAIDLLDGPVIICVDNFAEQATAVSAILAMVESREVFFLCAERSYRQRHIVRALGAISFRLIEGLELSLAEASQLVRAYVRRGLAGPTQAARHPDNFARRLVGEPVAVACCHILNDLRPLDSIVQSTYSAANEVERGRYLMAALAQFCFPGGVRNEILSIRAGRDRWDAQFVSAHPLPLDYVDGKRRNFVVPLNATLAERTLSRAPEEDIAVAFERLALGIGARVNREAIRQRTPEARLARQLLDYDDTIARFLPNGAERFYTTIRQVWRWNSRYWEQVALYTLAQFRVTKDESLLLQAVQHARHAVAIETHPFPLTTLGKVLLAQMAHSVPPDAYIYTEAQNALIQAIELEKRRDRASVHAYVTLFSGTLEFLERGGVLNSSQIRNIDEALDNASHYFPRDLELQELANRVSART